MSAAVFRAAMPHLQTLEAALGNDEFETGGAEGMCAALYRAGGGRYSLQNDFMYYWAGGVGGKSPRSDECYMHYITPLMYSIARHEPLAYEEAYTTRVLFLELLALLAEDGQVAP